MVWCVWKGEKIKKISNYRAFSHIFLRALFLFSLFLTPSPARTRARSLPLSQSVPSPPFEFSSTLFSRIFYSLLRARVFFTRFFARICFLLARTFLASIFFLARTGTLFRSHGFLGHVAYDMLLVKLGFAFRCETSKRLNRSGDSQN